MIRESIKLELGEPDLPEIARFYHHAKEKARKARQAGNAQVARYWGAEAERMKDLCVVAQSDNAS